MIVRPVLTSEIRHIRIGTEIYVDGESFTLAEVRDQVPGEPNRAPPYCKLDGGLPVGGLGDPPVWVSHLRVSARLPIKTKHPTPGLPRKRERHLRAVPSSREQSARDGRT